MDWKNKKVLVTGGASFISSHLVDKLVKAGAKVRVADDLSSGKLENLQNSINEIEFIEGDLKDQNFTAKVMEGIEVVFHLAAKHGGRGYIDSHPAECASNMALDGIVFEQAHKAGVERICYASSACVYPSYLQEEEGSSYLLKEEDADPFIRDKALADLEYGWAKLMGEMALRAYHKEYGMKTSAVRIFTAYGPRENETHAIMAFIARAFVKTDPYVIWGTGEQDRNFTYVEDIADAMILTSEKIEDGSAVNAGREDRITMNQAVKLVFKIMSFEPKELKYDLSKPTGVASRATDLTRAREVLNWEPKVSFEEGFKKSIDWYVSTHDAKKVEENLEKLLWER